MDEKWNALLEQLSEQFHADLDLQGVLYLIGVQELGKGYQEFSKDQKMDVLHVATCTLLEPYGFYVFDGKDKDGWPHWSNSEKLPALKPAQQHLLMKEAIIQYFDE